MEMKKIFVMFLLSIVGINVFAEMRYNPLNGLLYTYPEKQGINQDEYRQLLLNCIELESRLIAMNGNMQLPKEKVIDQFNFYLKSVGTVTAHRLMDDLKNNKVSYANGTFMKKIL